MQKSIAALRVRTASHRIPNRDAQDAARNSLTLSFSGSKPLKAETMAMARSARERVDQNG
jgi:hypothetical protein